MTASELVVIDDRQNAVAALARGVTDSLTSPHSKRAYAAALEAFMSWHEAQGRPALSKATINRYRAALIDRGLSSSSINVALSAVRKLASEAADNGALDQATAAAIGRVKGVGQKGRRSGNWLDKSAAQELLNTPDIRTVKGLRDRAVLAVMLGGGLRRSEVAALEFGHIQMRDARWVIVDLTGKGGRVRSVPIPSWVKVAIDTWRAAAGLEGGRVFRSVNRGGRVYGDGLTAQAVYNTVEEATAAAGLDVAAHDLRRTFAKLAHKGGAALEQIQISLGHSSIQTTERYLGVEQNLTAAPCDVLGLALEA